MADRALIDELKTELARLGRCESDYERLEIPRETDRRQLRRAFMARSHKYHPDLYSQSDPEARALAQEVFLQLSEAERKLRKIAPKPSPAARRTMPVSEPVTAPPPQPPPKPTIRIGSISGSPGNGEIARARTKPPSETTRPPAPPPPKPPAENDVVFADEAEILKRLKAEAPKSQPSAESRASRPTEPARPSGPRPKPKPLVPVEEVAAPKSQPREKPVPRVPVEDLVTEPPAAPLDGPRAMLLFGEALEAIVDGDLDGAAESLDRLIKADPENPSFQSTRELVEGYRHHARGEVEHALEHYHRACVVDEGCAEAMEQIRALHPGANDYREAEERLLDRLLGPLS